MRRRVFWTERKRGERAIERITKRKRKKKRFAPRRWTTRYPYLVKIPKRTVMLKINSIFLPNTTQMMITFCRKFSAMTVVSSWLLKRKKWNARFLF